MLSWLLTTLAVVVAAAVVIVVIKEIQSRKRAAFYAKQGFSPEISTGIPAYSKLIIKALGSDNEYGMLSDRMLAAKRSGHPGIVFNVPQSGTALIHIMDPALIREFALKDNEVSHRKAPTDFRIKIGFFMKHGDNALAQRSIFSEFFRMENLGKLMPIVHKIIDQTFEEHRTSHGSMDIQKSQEFVEGLMIKIATSLIFGEGAEVPKAANGLPVSEELMQILQLIISKRVFYHPLNILTRDWANYLNLLPGAREAHNRNKAMENQLAAYIKERTDFPEKYEKERKKFCLINMMLDYNEKAAENKKLTMEDMIGNCNLFLIASYDTTSTSIGSMLFALAQHPELQEKLREVVKPLSKPGLTFSELDDCELLEKLVRESLRTNPPAASIAWRHLQTDCTLGNFKFLKGDNISVPVAPLMWDGDQFASKKEFGLESINDQNKRQFMPFFVGKRNCVGQQLAQLELKLVAVYILNRFRLSPTTEKLRYCISFTMQVKDCDVKFTELK